MLRSSSSLLLPLNSSSLADSLSLSSLLRMDMGHELRRPMDQLLTPQLASFVSTSACLLGRAQHGAWRETLHFCGQPCAAWGLMHASCQ